SLSLTYESAGFDGPIGKSFSISGLSSITRCPRTIADSVFNGGVDLSREPESGGDIHSSRWNPAARARSFGGLLVEVDRFRTALDRCPGSRECMGVIVAVAVAVAVADLTVAVAVADLLVFTGCCAQTRCRNGH